MYYMQFLKEASFTLWSDLKILLSLSTLFSEWNFVAVHLKHKVFAKK